MKEKEPWTGSDLGAVIGSASAVLYGIIVPPMGFIVAGAKPSIAEFLVFAGYGFYYGLTFLIPSGVIGAITGWFVEILTVRAVSKLSMVKAFMIGCAIWLLPATLLSLVGFIFSPAKFVYFNYDTGIFGYAAWC